MKARRIPETTIAALVLGGCGSGSDSTANLASTVCTGLQRCDPEEFAVDYGSLSECVAYIDGELDDMLRNVSAACEQAYTAFLRCYYDSYADSCDEYSGYADCTSELADAYSACGSLLDD